MNDEMDTENEEPSRIESPSISDHRQRVPMATTSQPMSNINPSNTDVASSSAGNRTSREVVTIDDENSESTYHLKWIPWNSGKIPIVMQSINGPCPLIATTNVLLLREKIKLPPMLEQITASQLLTYLGECLTDSVPDELRNDENALLNFEQNIHDAIEILPKLKTGLDVNIKFGGISQFEYTPECIIFDILRIPLYHGWLSDPEFQDTIGNQSYNQLVDNIITNKSSSDPDTQARVLFYEEFLAQTASQLTIYGLRELRTKIKNNEIGILFRNNHFLTLLKREDEIYTLVTDHGYLTEDNIIWETLDNIEGAGRFFDSNFQLAEVAINSKQAEAMSNIDTRQKQVLEDYLMALELEREDANRQPQPTTSATDGAIQSVATRPHRSSTSLSEPGTHFQPTSPEDDFELAKRLQDEENRMYEEMMRERQARDADGQSWAVMERPEDRNIVPIGATEANETTVSQFSREPIIDLDNVTSFPHLGIQQTQEQQSTIDGQPRDWNNTLPTPTSTSSEVRFANPSDTTINQESSQSLRGEQDDQSHVEHSPIPIMQPTTNQSQVPAESSSDQMSAQVTPRDVIMVAEGSSDAAASVQTSANSRDINSEGTSQSHDNRFIRVTATSSNTIRQPSNDRTRHKSEKNSKESTCIVH